MFDQAKQLRRLARNFAQPGRQGRGPRPRLIVVSTGMEKLGATTVAANVAAGLSLGRRKTLLIDVDSQNGSIARLCGVKPSHTIADLLSGRRDLTGVIHPGPVGLDVIPGVRGLEKLSDYPSEAIARLATQLDLADPDTAFVVLDLGSEMTDLARRAWEIADLAVLVSAPDDDPILETYAIIKTMTAKGAVTPIRLVINRAADQKSADDIYARLAHAAKQFLDLRLGTLGWLAEDPMIEAADRAGNLLAAAAANCESGRTLRSFAEMIAYETIGGYQVAEETSSTKSTRKQLPPTLTALAELLGEPTHVRKTEDSRRA